MATRRLRTIKNTGGNYTTLAACEAGEDDSGDLVAADVYLDIECYKSASDAAAQNTITFAGFTTDATRYINVYTPPAERHNGISGGYQVTSGGFANAITINTEGKYVRIDGICFIAATNPNGAILLDSAVTHNVRITNCLQIGAGGTYGFLRCLAMTGGEVIVVNNIKVGAATQIRGIYAAGGSGYTIRAYNNTFYDTSTGAGSARVDNTAAITFIAKNNIVDSANNGTPCYSGSFSSSNNNVSSDTSAPGTSSQTSVHPTYVDAGNGDLHLSASDTIAKGQGANLIADGGYPFSDDIDGDTRPSAGAWCIGADEVVGGGGSVDLAGAATAAAIAAGTLTQQQALAAAAVSAALAAGTLSVSAPLSASAIASAVGSAALTVFSRVARMPTDAPNGTTVWCTLLGPTQPYTVLQNISAVVAGGFVDVPYAALAPGVKRPLLIENWDADLNTTSIRSAFGIATITDL